MTFYVDSRKHSSWTGECWEVVTQYLPTEPPRQLSYIDIPLKHTPSSPSVIEQVLFDRHSSLGGRKLVPIPMIVPHTHSRQCAAEEKGWGEVSRKEEE